MAVRVRARVRVRGRGRGRVSNIFLNPCPPTRRTGELPNLFARDEVDAILAEVG